MSTARRLWSRSGQATVEYALILLALAGATLVPLGGTTFAGQTKTAASSFAPSNSFMGACISAYNAYYTSYYYVLNLPFP